jgi:hypothetical protein
LASGSITVAQTNEPETDYRLTGRVLDMNGKPIPYASVGLLQHQIGTSTNLSGGFLVIFKPDSLIESDTLVINVLGYKSFRQALNSINDTLIVRLENHIYKLKEVIITNLSAADIVAKAFKFKKKNYPAKKFKTEVFFRGLIRNDSTYVMMTEAVLNITDKGYHKHGDTKFYLNQLKYIDERDLDSLDIHYDNFTENNEVYRLWELDYMNYAFDKISWFPAKYLKYELDSITYFDNHPVYCISVNAGKRFYNRLFIRMDNFALIEVQRGMYLGNPNQQSTAEKLGNISYGVDDKHSRMEVIQYKPYKGKWYLSYVSLTSSVIGGDRQKVKRLANEKAREEGTSELNYSGIEYDGRILDPDKNNYFRHDELLIIHIFNKKEKIEKGQLMAQDKYVHRYKVPYDEEFWRNYRQLQLNPNLKRANRHLKEAEILNTTSK